MFCYQCEQTSGGKGCTVKGACGKDAATSDLQDLLVHAAKGISMFAHRARGLGAADPEVDRFVIEALFTTVTNVNFDPDRLVGLLRKAAAIRDRARAMYETACAKAGRTPEILGGPAAWRPAADLAGLLAQAPEASISRRIAELGADLAGLEELCAYGLKGAAAYADHAAILGRTDDGIFGAFQEALAFLAEGKPTVEEMLRRSLAVGELTGKAMELLDRAHTETFGHPRPTPVRIAPVAGKAVVVSGHDLLDLRALLEQTDGRGISVYTHGEMLPAHGYPELKKHRHLVGNYGGAWQDQAKEFDAFPGAILMTTNCLQKPRDSYKDRIFTSGLVAWPGVRHIADRDFAPVIEAALAAPGFPATEPERTILVGFGHEAVLGVADRIIEAVKKGAIRRFFLVGGCDGAKPGRNYYTDFARAVPKDCIILTLACGKYRFNKLEFGEVAGLPRLLDIGQCNDAYSAIRIAASLAEAFGVGVNDLPLSLILSWYEQKAVAILLALLHLGIRNIRLGPSLPAFVTPAALEILADRYGIRPIGKAEEDLAEILGEGGGS